MVDVEHGRCPALATAPIGVWISSPVTLATLVEFPDSACVTLNTRKA